MGLVFVNQTAFVIKARVGVDITGALELLIKYRKPDGTLGEFSAISVDDDTGVIQYSVASEDDIDQAGPWVFWGYVTFADGKSAPGETFEHWFYPEGYRMR